MIRRTATAPWCTTGRSTALLSPMMATSGALMIGVEAMPPSLPRLVTVMVEPDEFLARRLVRCARARRARRISAATSHRPSDCALRTTGTLSPSGVCVAMPTCTARWRTSTPRAASYSTLHCGNDSSTRTSARITSGR